MFPSAGYFSSLKCPFFVHGLCHRPCCHFRHVKTEHTSDGKPVKGILKKKSPSSVKQQSLQSSSENNAEEKNQPCAQVKAPYDVQVTCGLNAVEETNKKENFSDEEDIQNLTPLQETIIRFYDHKKNDNDGKTGTVEPLVPSSNSKSQVLSPLINNTGEILSDKTENDCGVVKVSSPSLEENKSLENEISINSANSETVKGSVSLETNSAERLKNVADSSDNELTSKDCSIVNNIEINAHSPITETLTPMEDMSVSATPCDVAEIKKTGDADIVTVDCTVSPEKKGARINNAIIVISDSSDDVNNSTSKLELSPIKKRKKLHHKRTKQDNDCTNFDSGDRKESRVKKYSAITFKTPEEKAKRKHSKSKKIKLCSNNSDSKSTTQQILLESNEIDKSAESSKHLEVHKHNDEDMFRELFGDGDHNFVQKKEKPAKTSRSQGDEKIRHSKVEAIHDRLSSVKKHFLPSSSSMDTELLGLVKKRRIAHESKQATQRSSTKPIVRRKFPNMVTPHERIKKMQEQQAASSLSSATPSTSNHNASKPRVAHVPKPEPKTKSGLKRPKISLEYGSKVPQNLRQRYLEKIVDEYLRLCSTEKSAFKKAVEEEKQLYERSSRRQVYVNLCINSIKKLRGMNKIESEVIELEPESEQGGAPGSVGKKALSRTSSGESEKLSNDCLKNLTEETFYDQLIKYLMTEEQLVDNGYPRPSPGNPGIAVIKNAKQRRPSNDVFSADQNCKRICNRCGKPFMINEEGRYLTCEECVYHHGRLYRKRAMGEVTSSFSCCQGDAGSKGCCVAKVHVSQNMDDFTGFMTTITNPLAATSKKVFGLDCEMCYTVAGLELTRVTVVDWKLDKVYDTFVKPARSIVDYNTRFSGVTDENLRGVTTTMREVQAVLISMILKNAILVGHSLESDLKALKLIHSQVVDTSIVFPHRLGPPYKRALRNLMAEHLQKIIQDSEGGHDSLEDAAAALELMQMKATDDMRKKARNKR